ncbi:unnamed protein product [Diatraea saccharalis]|uniref:Uncharacterized protein n=1 Tax=Diatraea saccharalis TaxID=40085 RepID=A0A9N9WEV3_9NEOP|nr:unnamed protein product [Diatraea saccharalis]
MVSLDDDGPYSYIPSDAFVLDDVASTLTQLPNKKTVKKDLSRFDRAIVPRIVERPFSHLTSSAKEYLNGCEEFLQRSAPVRDLPNYINFLRSLCFLNSQLGSAIGSSMKENHFEKQPERNIDGNTFTLHEISKKLGNLDGYTGNLDVEEKSKYVSDFGIRGNEGVYGNLGAGIQGDLFGNIGKVGNTRQDDLFHTKDDWSIDYPKSILNLLLHDAYVGKFPKLDMGNHEEHDHLSQNTKFAVGGEGIEGDYVEVNERKGGLAGKREHLENDEINNVWDVLENVESPNDQIKQMHALSNVAGLRDFNDDCDFELYTGKSGKLTINENFGHSSSDVGNPCVHVYVSPRYQNPLQLFGPINGRREWTVLGGNNDKR